MVQSHDAKQSNSPSAAGIGGSAGAATHSNAYASAFVFSAALTHVREQPQNVALERLGRDERLCLRRGHRRLRPAEYQSAFSVRR